MYSFSPAFDIIKNVKGFHTGLIRMIGAVVVAATFSVPSQASADQLTLYFYPAPRRINWSNPRTPHRQRCGKYVSSPAISAPAFDWPRARCRLKCGENEILTGMTNSDDSDESDAILNDGEGLGVLFRNIQRKTSNACKKSKRISTRAFPKEKSLR